MKYLCLVYEEEETLNTLSRAEWDALRRETMDYVKALRDRGQLLVAEPLQSVRTAVTVRVRGGKLSMTDGPFAETKEQLGGFFLIDAKDLNEALQIASQWPSARLGSIEVRPVEAQLRDEGRYAPLARRA
ncbi:MAG TPA: YciI family protein [Gammaproteobacteria bacterium]